MLAFLFAPQQLLSFPAQHPGMVRGVVAVAVVITLVANYLVAVGKRIKLCPACRKTVAMPDPTCRHCQHTFTAEENVPMLRVQNARRGRKPS